MFYLTPSASTPTTTGLRDEGAVTGGISNGAHNGDSRGRRGGTGG